MLKIFETAKLTDKLLFSQAVFVRIRSIKRNNSKNAKNLITNEKQWINNFENHVEYKLSEKSSLIQS